MPCKGVSLQLLEYVRAEAGIKPQKRDCDSGGTEEEMRQKRINVQFYICIQVGGRELGLGPLGVHLKIRGERTKDTTSCHPQRHLSEARIYMEWSSPCPALRWHTGPSPAITPNWEAAVSNQRPPQPCHHLPGSQQPWVPHLVQ